MRYFLPEKPYKVMKWAVTLAIPAATTAYVGLAAVWAWPYADQVAQTSAIVCTCIGTLIGVSKATAKPDDEEEEDA